MAAASAPHAIEAMILIEFPWFDPALSSRMLVPAFFAVLAIILMVLGERRAVEFHTEPGLVGRAHAAVGNVPRFALDAVILDPVHQRLAGTLGLRAHHAKMAHRR